MTTTLGSSPVIAAWKALIEGLLEAVWLVDAASLQVVAANTAAGQLLRTRPKTFIGRHVTDLSATPEDLAFWDEVVAGTSDGLWSDTWVRRLDGELVPVTRRVTRVRVPDAPGLEETAQRLGGLLVVALHDRSAQRDAESALEARLAELRATLESTADGILVTDLAGAIRGFNRHFAMLWGLPDELLAKGDDAAVHAWMRRSVTDADVYARRLEAIRTSRLLHGTDTLTLCSGRVLERITLPQVLRGEPIGRVYSFRDITERLAARQRIEDLSYTDTLTGLPNRHLLADRVEFALAMAQREQQPFALMVLNLDRFKHINETLGLGVGDRVLREAAERVRACLRMVDTVARLGGDEFVLLVHNVDEAGAEATARRVLDAFRLPFRFESTSFTVTCSIGIALSPADGASLDELARRADAAMQRVKEAGRASFRFHQGSDDVDPRSHMRLDHAMRQALVSDQFRLHYQPQVDLKTGRVVGAEALIRWHDPVLGNVSPGEFIPIAEASGFIIHIGDWVLGEAVRQAVAWHRDGLEMAVSINVSALQFQQPDFVRRIADTLASSGLPPYLLELELTESILIHDAQDALRRLQALKKLGVMLAIDDFGTGYSSLAYLRQFPIHRLKIDRTFIKTLPGDDGEAAIVNAIVQLARTMHLRVIAEGVETEPQRQFLVDAGCDEFQGFLHAPALEAAAFRARLLRDALVSPAIRLVAG